VSQFDGEQSMSFGQPEEGEWSVRTPEGVRVVVADGTQDLESYPDYLLDRATRMVGAPPRTRLVIFALSDYGPPNYDNDVLKKRMYEILKLSRRVGGAGWFGS
jgi:hypothetical protein